MTAAAALTRWELAQQFEREYWYPGGCTSHGERRATERETQAWYAGLLYLEHATPASVLEIGAGPQGLLARYAPNALDKIAVEPLRLTFADRDAYIRANTQLVEMPIELWHERNRFDDFDEVWMTNVLQHVEDPELVLRIVRTHARRRVRVFEWVDEPVSVVHLHSLRGSQIAAAFADFDVEHHTEGLAGAGVNYRQAFVATVYRRSA